MPNHITNRLKIIGEPHEVQKLFKDISGDDVDGTALLIDFNKIKPMPESLDIEAGSNTNIGLSIYQIYSFGLDKIQMEKLEFDTIKNRLGDCDLELTDDGVAQFITTEEGQQLYELGKLSYENIQLHGDANWYDWRNRHWGTKWNAYSQSRLDDNTIEFLTAWSGVPRLIGEIAKAHPNVEIEYMYADEDWGSNVGEFEYRGESMCSSEITSWSDRAKEIATELLGYNPESEE